VRDIQVVQENGFTSAMFTRLLNTGDSRDKVIQDVRSSFLDHLSPLSEFPLQTKLRIIFAFNPTTNELQYHGPTRSSARYVNFIEDCTISFSSFIRFVFTAVVDVRPLGPPKPNKIPQGLIIFVGIVAALGTFQVLALCSLRLFVL